MRLHSDNLERTAIASITSGSDKVASWLMPRLTLDHFRLDHNREAYRRVLTVVRKDGEIPTWENLIEDIALSQDSREELATREVATVPSRKVASKLVDRLEEYRRVRTLFDMSKRVSETLKGDKVDLDELTDQASDFLFKARSSSDITSAMYHVGDERLDMKFIKSLLVQKDNEFLPTGFRAFDSRNQGVPRGSCFLMAGPTGSGKCLDGDTLVPTNLGLMTLRQIREYVNPNSGYGKVLAERSLRVYSRSGPRDVVGTFKGSGRVMRVTFSDGRSVTGLPDHKLWVRTLDGGCVFKRLDELREGDRLPTYDEERTVGALRQEP